MISNPRDQTNLLTFTAPVYSAELAPPSLRGLFVGMNGVNIALGYGLASYMGMGEFSNLLHDSQTKYCQHGISSLTSLNGEVRLEWH
jgi:hypothetical protein